MLLLPNLSRLINLAFKADSSFPAVASTSSSTSIFADGSHSSRADLTFGEAIVDTFGWQVTHSDTSHLQMALTGEVSGRAVVVDRNLVLSFGEAGFAPLFAFRPTAGATGIRGEPLFDRTKDDFEFGLTSVRQAASPGALDVAVAQLIVFASLKAAHLL